MGWLFRYHKYLNMNIHGFGDRRLPAVFDSSMSSRWLHCSTAFCFGSSFANCNLFLYHISQKNKNINTGKRPEMFSC